MTQDGVGPWVYGEREASFSSFHPLTPSFSSSSSSFSSFSFLGEVKWSLIHLQVNVGSRDYLHMANLYLSEY